MWFSSKKIKIETILDAFDKRNELAIDCLVNSLADLRPLIEISEKETFSRDALIKDEGFLKILRIECSVYSSLLFDLMLFGVEISDEKSRHISKQIYKKICERNDMSLDRFFEILSPREELFTKRVRSDPNHLGKNLQDLVARVVYAFLEREMCHGALALNSDSFLTFEVYSAFQNEYIQGIKSSSMKKLLEDIKSKTIEGMS